MSPSRRISLDRGDVGVRVDRVLLRHLRDLPGISRNKIQRWIDAGSVSINDEPSRRVSSRIAPGDRLTVELPDVPARRRPAAENLPLDVLFQDDDLIVVNKPAGQVSHPAFRNVSGTLLNALLAHARGEWIPRLVNRLDKGTSGLVLIAKSKAAYVALQRSTGRHAIQKEYVAIVRGRPSSARGTIDLALDRDPRDRRRVMVRARGSQPSITRYERVSSGRDSEDAVFSVVRCRLVTGRTHQIRVHLAARNWPIVGDTLYGVKDRRIGRQALHAWKLAFDHPRTQQPIELEAPIPDDILRLIEETNLRV